MDTPTPEKTGFSGAIVLKARTPEETAALAQQLARFAAFGEVFANRYEAGYAVKGQVYATPQDADPVAQLEAQARAQAAQLGAQGERIQTLEWELRDAQRALQHAQTWRDMLTSDEQFRLVGRNLTVRPEVRQRPVVEPQEGEAPMLAFARQVVELVAQRIQAGGPDNVHVTERAAQACAALARTFLADAPFRESTDGPVHWPWPDTQRRSPDDR